MALIFFHDLFDQDQRKEEADLVYDKQSVPCAEADDQGDHREESHEVFLRITAGCNLGVHIAVEKVGKQTEGIACQQKEKEKSYTGCEK